MVYESKNYDHLLGGLKGFSDALLQNHFTLYAGYVTNTNQLADAMNVSLKEGKAETAEYAELKRRFGWEFNGMRLHEYYFENIARGGGSLDPKSGLFQKITESFGSYESWERDFKAVGAMRGIGWAGLYFDGRARRLFNVWINEHDGGHLSGAAPLLLMDVFEHAFMMDYGVKRADYIEAFFGVLDWGVVFRRWTEASS
jgi:superoxide dismutase, Fe-Mn family